MSYEDLYNPVICFLFHMLILRIADIKDCLKLISAPQPKKTPHRHHQQNTDIKHGQQVVVTPTV